MRTTRIYLILSINLFILLGSEVQSQVLEKGSVNKALFKTFEPNIIGEDDKNIYVLDTYGDTYGVRLIVESFSKVTLERIYSKEYKILLVGRKLESISFLDGNIVYLISANVVSRKNDEGKRNNSSSLVAYIIDGETAEISSPDTIIETEFQGNPATTFGEKYQKMMGRFDVKTSKNNKRILVKYSTHNFELERIFQRIYVFDSELNLIKEKEVIKPEEEAEELIPNNVTVDDEGSLYYLENSDLVLLDFYKDYEEWREPFPMDIFESNADGSNLSGTFNDEGDLILTASYVTTDVEDTDENKESSETLEGDTQLEGVICLKINTLDKALEYVTVSKFDQDFIDEFLDEDLIDDELDAEVNNVFNRFQYVFSKEVTYVVGEALDRGNHRLKSLGDIVVYSFNNENGELNWAHRVPRLQHPNKAMSVHGVITFSDQDYVYILFQDEEDNFDEMGKRNIMDLKDLDHDIHAVVVLYSFNKGTGEMNYSMQPDWNSRKYLINPKYSISAKEGIFVFMQDRDQYQLARIKFDEE